MDCEDAYSQSISPKFPIFQAIWHSPQPLPMRRLLHSILACSLLTICLGAPLTSIAKTSTNEESVLCEPPAELIDIILKSAAKDLEICYTALKQDYEKGDCSIIEITPKEFAVISGGGMTTVILDDLL